MTEPKVRVQVCSVPVSPESGGRCVSRTPDRADENDFPKTPKTQNLELYGNQLQGTLPPEISILNQLANLRLDSNAFIGTLPPQLSTLYSRMMGSKSAGGYHGDFSLYNNNGLCGSTSSFSGLYTSGTSFGHECPMQPCKWCGITYAQFDNLHKLC